MITAQTRGYYTDSEESIIRDSFNNLITEGLEKNVLDYYDDFWKYVEKGQKISKVNGKIVVEFTELQIKLLKTLLEFDGDEDYDSKVEFALNELFSNDNYISEFVSWYVGNNEIPEECYYELED